MAKSKLFGRNAALNYWPAVADFMLALFMIALTLGLLGSVLGAFQAVGGMGLGQTISLEDYNKLRKELDRLNDENATLNDKIASLVKATKKGESEREFPSQPDVVTISKEELTRLKQLSPILRIGEAGQMRFKSGSADISSFREYVTGEMFNDIKGHLDKAAGRINTILIVGHTDRSSIMKKQFGGNLDTALIPAFYANNSTGAAKLSPGSNADLGLMRAVAARNELAPLLVKAGYAQVQIRCLSAAGAIEPDGETTPLEPEKDISQEKVREESRRRIDILLLGLQR